MHLSAGAEQGQGGGDERPLDGEEQGPDEACGEQRAAKVMHELILVSSPVGLRDQTGRRHAQEAEGPVDGVKEDAADGNTTQGSGTGQMTGEDGIHHGEQRLSQVGKNERDGEEEDSTVPVGHSHGCVYLGFHIDGCFANWLRSLRFDSCPVLRQSLSQP